MSATLSPSPTVAATAHAQLRTATNARPTSGPTATRRAANAR
jgi:hypothetical protein